MMKSPIPNMYSTQKASLVILIILSLLGVLAVISGTRWGIGLSPDSIAYIAGARSLAMGNGFTTPSSIGEPIQITVRGPFYSMLLAVFSLSGSDPMQAARWLNALLFGISIFTVGWVISSFSGSDRQKFIWFPIFGSFLFLVSALMLEIHLMAWSEVAFITLSLGGLVSLGQYLDHQKMYLLVLSSILIGLALLTRYAGIALTVTGGLGILLFSTSSIKNRIRDAILFGFLSFLPLILWFARNYMIAGTATGRKFIFHPIGIAQIKQALTTISSWLLVPQNASAIIKTIPFTLIIIVFVFITVAKKSESDAEQKGFFTNINTMPGIIKLILIFLPVYAVFLMISITYADANTPLDGRILSIVFVTGLILILYIANEFLRLRHNSYGFKISLIIIGIIFAAVYCKQSSSILIKSNREGIGFNSTYWRQSEILSQIKGLPDTYIIYTNSPEAIYVHTNRQALLLPKKYESMTQLANMNYQAEMAEMAQKIKEDKAVLVFFNNVQIPTLPTEEELLESIPLHDLVITDDGVIFGSDPNQG